MSWWRRARIEDLDDRNDTNARIQKLIALAELLRYSAKLVFQTARGARALAGQVATNKSLSSFPTVQDVLQEADRVALDSPKKFGELCKAAAQIIEERIADLESERHEWTQHTNPNRLKGLVEDE